MDRITSATDFKGQKTEYTCDDIGRLEYVSIYNADAVPEAVLNLAYTYDTKGNVSIVEATTCSSGCSEEFNYTYDSDRNLLESRDGVDDLGSVEYEYDGAGRLDILEYPIAWDTSSPPTVTDTFQREYAYDLANRVTEVRDGETSAPFAQYDYNQASQRTRIDYGNDSYSLYEYDDYGRLSLLANVDPEKMGTGISFVKQKRSARFIVSRKKVSVPYRYASSSISADFAHDSSFSATILARFPVSLAWSRFLRSLTIPSANPSAVGSTDSPTSCFLTKLPASPTSDTTTGRPDAT